jgi:hypothetical protein
MPTGKITLPRKNPSEVWIKKSEHCKMLIQRSCRYLQPPQDYLRLDKLNLKLKYKTETTPKHGRQSCIFFRHRGVTNYRTINIKESKFADDWIQQRFIQCSLPVRHKSEMSWEGFKKVKIINRIFNKTGSMFLHAVDNELTKKKLQQYTLKCWKLPWNRLNHAGLGRRYSVQFDFLGLARLLLLSGQVLTPNQTKAFRTLFIISIH